MSESDSKHGTARPRQVTVAGVMATAACLLLVVSLFDSMATVRSADMHNRVAEFLRTPPGDGLGLDVTGVITLLRGVVLFSGAVAAAGVVLAIFALQRHRGARIGLSIAAVLMLFSATFVSGILPVVVAVAATMMWSRDARDWFDGRDPRPRPAPATAGPPPGPGSPGSGSDLPGTPPPATYPYGMPPGRQTGALPGQQQGLAAGQPPGQQLGRPPGPPLGYPTRPAGARPTAVTVAAWLTWGFSALVALVFTMVVLTILLDRDQLLSEMQKNPTLADAGFSTQQILGFMWVLSAVSIFWALASMALAALAFRRIEAARVALVVSSALAGLVGLVAVPFGWPHAIAAFACVVLLSRRSTRAWFAGQDLPAPGPSKPYSPPPSGKPPVW